MVNPYTGSMLAVKASRIVLVASRTLTKIVRPGETKTGVTHVQFVAVSHTQEGREDVGFSPFYVRGLVLQHLP